tara:strand:- start:391 stop:711 length:321 start_codon:yes stop_codon:yes gene_type:complete
MKNELPEKKLKTLIVTRTVSNYFFDDPNQIFAKNRHKTIKEAQRFAFYILKNYLHLTYEEIGALFKYNHANIQYHVKTLAFNLNYVQTEKDNLKKLLEILKLKKDE